MPDVPKIVVVDSGPIVALFDTDDSYYQMALDFVSSTRASLITTMAVVTEAMYVFGKNLLARKNLLSWIKSGGLALVEPEGDDFDRIGVLIEKYADLPMDFTDAVVVALCERLGVHHIASVDRDFGIYRYKGRTKFTNVFFE